MIQIKLSVAAVRNVRGLPFLEDFRKRVAYLDLFDWLQFCFGFQVILICFLLIYISHILCI